MPGGTPNERYHRGHYMKFLPVFFLSEIKISWVGQSTRGQIDFHKKKQKNKTDLFCFQAEKAEDGGGERRELEGEVVSSFFMILVDTSQT